MAQRLVRAKGKIRDVRIPYRVPDEADLPDRLRSALSVVYFIFNEGHTASSGDRLVREDLCTEAVRLGRPLAELMPDEPEVMGLLALMLLVESRRATRTTQDGDLVSLADQDRARWDRGLIAEGQHACGATTARSLPDPGSDQRRPQRRPGCLRHGLVADRGALRPALHVGPEPGRRPQPRGRGGRGRRPDAALTLVERLELDGYHLFHTIRADLLRRLGRNAEAAAAYEGAIARTENATERDFLQRSREALTQA